MNEKDFKGAKFIWLPKDLYPEYQISKKTKNAPNGETLFCSGEFKKTFNVQSIPSTARINIFADTRYRLHVNGDIIGNGPVNNGGDFITEESLPLCYYSTYELELKKGNNEIYVEVSIMPIVDTETSQGHGGLILSLTIDYENGSSEVITTDNSWLCRRNTKRPNYNWLDNLRTSDAWNIAEEIENIWTLKASPIPNLDEDFISFKKIHVADQYKHRLCVDNGEITIKNGSPLTFIIEFEMIYSGYFSFIYGGGDIALSVGFQEILGKNHSTEHVWLKGDYKYNGWRLQSAGYISVTVSFCDKNDCVFNNIGILYTRYPTGKTGMFICSDEGLNRINKVCRHTIEICRQHLHLDSPVHQELLSCTADYYVQSLAGFYTFQDSRLMRFDIVRICDLLRFTGGEMFHTTYSLIFIEWISKYYKYTGDKSVLYETIDALHLIFEFFKQFTHEDGIIQTAISYMFVDWIEVDGISLHHPPKALGQTVLNAFYYNALKEMVYICSEISDNRKEEYQELRDQLKGSFHDVFWDNERQMYFDGLSDREEESWKWRPANVDKRYYTRNSNVLAVLYGLAPEEIRKQHLEKVINDKNLPRMQPYFMHYALEALYDVGLFYKYGLAEILKWTEIIDECDKGLKEVWTGFDCDYSHGWGSTPAYQLPSKILGLEILEPGFKKIRLKPDLFGLSWANMSIPTPFGFIHANLNDRGDHSISIPKGIEVV